MRLPDPRASLATKLIALIVPVAVLAIAAMTLLAVSRSSDAQRASVKDGLRELAARHANAIDARAAGSAEVARSLAAVLRTDATRDRALATELLRGVSLRHPELNGSYFSFERDAFGADRDFAGRPGETPSGRYAPYFYWEKGELLYDGTSDEIDGKPWYEGPKRTGKDFVQEPYVGINGVAMTTYSSPITRRGRFVGTASVDVALQDIQRTVQRLEVLDGGYALLVTNRGTLLTAPRKGIAGKKRLDQVSPALRGVVQAVRSGRGTQIEGRDPFGERDVIVSSAPVATGGWSLVTVAPTDVAMAPVSSLRTTLLLVGLVALLLLTAAVVLAARMLTGPLRGFVSRMRGLADDDVPALASGMEAIARGDLTVEVRADAEPAGAAGRDEVARASAALDDVVRSTRTSVEAYENTRAALREVLGEVARGATDVAGASQQVAGTSADAGRTAQEIARAIEEVAVGAERQAGMVGEVQSRAERMAETVRGSASGARATAEAADAARDAARDGADRVAGATQAMAAVSASSEEATAAMRDLAQRSARIGDIVTTITGIAEQTNLLALNAAIEAARAGEQGRGFAVVAEEVRSLAESSQSAAGSIADLVAEIQAETERTVRSVEEGAQRTAETAGVVDDARGAFEAISRAVEDVSTRAADIAAAAERVAGDTEHVQREVSEMAAVAGQSSAAAEQVSASTQETTASTGEIATAAGDLARAAEDLDALVRRFRLV